MKYSWHKDLFDSTLHRCANFFDEKSRVVSLDGFFDWWEERHPELYRKFDEVERKRDELWGKEDAGAMKEFKKLVKQYEEAVRWAVGRCVEERVRGQRIR